MTEEPWQEPRLPQEQISTLALGLFIGEVFMNGQINEGDEHLMPMIFMPLALMSKEQAEAFNQHPPAMVCGRMQDALPRSINGYPMFTSMTMVYAQDAKLIRECWKKLQAAADEILKPQ